MDIRIIVGLLVAYGLVVTVVWSVTMRWTVKLFTNNRELWTENLQLRRTLRDTHEPRGNGKVQSDGTAG